LGGLPLKKGRHCHEIRQSDQQLRIHRGEKKKLLGGKEKQKSFKKAVARRHSMGTRMDEDLKEGVQEKQGCIKLFKSRSLQYSEQGKRP